jgi:hypothetical protein
MLAEAIFKELSCLVLGPSPGYLVGGIKGLPGPRNAPGIGGPSLGRMGSQATQLATFGGAHPAWLLAAAVADAAQQVARTHKGTCTAPAFTAAPVHTTCVNQGGPVPMTVAWEVTGTAFCGRSRGLSCVP